MHSKHQTSGKGAEELIPGWTGGKHHTEGSRRGHKMILSSASIQKFLSISIFTMVALSLIYLHSWLVAWSHGADHGVVGGFDVKEGRGGDWESRRERWHRNVGVLKYVNPKIGTYGVTPNGNGGMIPSVGMPFGMTRWTAQTREVRRFLFCVNGLSGLESCRCWLGPPLSGEIILLTL